MKFSEQLGYRFFDYLIDKNIRFAIYRLPGEEDINFVMQNSGESMIFNDFSELDGKKGFVIAPFQISRSSPLILIIPDIVLTGMSNILNYLAHTPFDDTRKGRFTLPETARDTFDQYKEGYEKFHGQLVKGEFEKLVLSRTKDVLIDSSFSAGKSFERACKKYPDNFIFLCNAPETGTWFGCSPEILLAKQDDFWTTVALAGTQEYTESMEDIVWDAKNRLEQKIVVEYMYNQLLKAGIVSTNNNPKTIKSGNVVHLKSEFKFQLEDLSKLGELLKLLHPSPAVCGFPKQKAFDFIVKNEGYNRQYYSGFVGFMDANAQTDLFVNLRCMQIFRDSVRLYAGGGILPSSDVESEWMETKHKLQTILSVIKE